MSADIRRQQRWLIAGVAVLAVLLILVVVALFRSIQARGDGPKVGHRSPAADLAYCVPEDTKLCIISFGQIEGGDMLVNFQLPSTIYPPFSLVIDRYGVESSYVCQRTKGFLGGITCAGPSQVPGEALVFKVISKTSGVLMAVGKFPIIGIAISTPEEVFTPEPTETPTEVATMTPSPAALPPTQNLSTPTPRTPFPTTYPNPTYP